MTGTGGDRIVLAGSCAFFFLVMNCPRSSFTLFDDRSNRCCLLCNGFGELQEQCYTSECDALGS